jgi:class 3 adenylate cyclase
MCFVSDTTRNALTREADDLVFVDEFEVRGRQAKVKLWALPDPEEPDSDEQAVESERGAIA